MRGRYVAILALLFTVAFFIEYTPLYPRVHIPYDLDGFHYPLADYAFRAIRDGRIPQWDAANYCGFGFAANIQAALFYPPSWVMFALGNAKSGLPYNALQYLVMAHIWLAFLLCYWWLSRSRGLHWLAAVLGAGIFAFSGYPMLQMQHLGQICGYAWFPLGFMGIDEAERDRCWRPLWKLACASAMCLLAGYAILWTVFAVCMLSYAACRARPIRSSGVALGGLLVSLLFAAVQLLPTMEASAAKVPDPKYGEATGIRDPAFYLSYVVPNYFDFGLDTDVKKNPGQEYLYLGAPALIGLGMLLVRRRFRDAVAPFGVLLVSLAFVINPGRGLGWAVQQSTLLSQVVTDWNFLAGISAAVVLLAALGLDSALKPRAVRATAGAKLFALASTGAAWAWSFYLLRSWWNGGSALPIEWQSALTAAASVAVCGALILVCARGPNAWRKVAALSLLLVAGAEYKAFGTSRRFNAVRGPVISDYSLDVHPGFNRTTHEYLRRRPQYRAITDDVGPYATDFRHLGLATPQGFDPFLPSQYVALIQKIGHFRDNRQFSIDPRDTSAMRLLGAGYVITGESGSLYPSLKADPRYRLLEPLTDFYKVFELVDATPAFGWESDGAGGAEMRAWTAELRRIFVRSAGGGAFRLSEQYVPGWTAAVDGKAVLIERCHDAFQCIGLPAGEHTVEFRYRSIWLLPGAIVSLASILLAVVAVRYRRRADAP